MEFKTQVKLEVYRHFASTGRAPTLHEASEALRASRDAVQAAFHQLRADRIFFLEPDGATIRMAPPFSGVPTQHRVLVGDREYFANCA